MNASLRWPGGVVVASNDAATTDDFDVPVGPALKSAKAKAKAGSKGPPSLNQSRRHQVSKYSSSYTSVAAFPATCSTETKRFSQSVRFSLCFL